MSGLLSSFIEPVYRRARRLSGIEVEADNPEQSHAYPAPAQDPSTLSTAASEQPPEVPISSGEDQLPTLQPQSTARGDQHGFASRNDTLAHGHGQPRSIRRSLTAIGDLPLRQHHPPNAPPVRPINADNGMSYNPSQAGHNVLRTLRRLDDIESDATQQTRPGNISVGTRQSSDGENPLQTGQTTVNMSSLLPADDGMQYMRKRLHEIRALDVSAEEKARRMHMLMTEQYHALRGAAGPKSPSSANTQDRPFTPNSNQSVSEWGTHGASPASVFSLPNPDNPYNISESDLLPTYRIKETRQSTSETPGEEVEEADDDEEPVLGCRHYKRNVKIQCFDCRRWYTCRFCHDELEMHALNRRKTENMLCMICRTPQAAASHCTKCGEPAAWYFCDICKLWDNDSKKRIYHCPDCGICRRGEGLGKDYYHCKVLISYWQWLFFLLNSQN
jgi:uncharacterized CHY-type Zn-finger protein